MLMQLIFELLVCPDEAITRGPCIYDESKNRAFRRIEKRAWRRDGCRCIPRPVEVTTELCGCRNEPYRVNKCSTNPKDKDALLLIKTLREEFVTKDGEAPMCRVNVETRSALFGWCLFFGLFEQSTGSNTRFTF